MKKACTTSLFVVLIAESPESLLLILHLESNASFPIFMKDEACDCRFAYRVVMGLLRKILQELT